MRVLVARLSSWLCRFGRRLLFSPFNVLDAAVESDGCARLSIGDETMLHLGIEDIEGRVYGFVLPHPSRTGDEEFAIRFPGQHTDWVVLVEEE